MEELRSMLGWITVHWRAQKQQWLHKKNREASSQDNIYSTMCPVTEVTQQAFEIIVFYLFSISMTNNMIKKNKKKNKSSTLSPSCLGFSS